MESNRDRYKAIRALEKIEEEAAAKQARRAKEEGVSVLTFFPDSGPSEKRGRVMEKAYGMEGDARMKASVRLASYSRGVDYLVGTVIVLADETIEAMKEGRTAEATIWDEHGRPGKPISVVDIVAENVRDRRQG